MDPHRHKAQKFWQEDGVGIAGTWTLTHAAEATLRHCVEHISGSGDVATLVTLEAPSGTVLWRKRFTGAFTFSESFPPGLYVGGKNEALVLRFSASTANSEGNMAGYSFQG